MLTSLSLVISSDGMMVLNAELKSMNSIFRSVLSLSKWERAE